MSEPERYWFCDPRDPDDPADVRAAEMAERLLNAQGKEFWRASIREATRLAAHGLAYGDPLGRAEVRDRANSFAREWLERQQT